MNAINFKYSLFAKFFATNYLRNSAFCMSVHHVNGDAKHLRSMRIDKFHKKHIYRNLIFASGERNVAHE